MPPSLHVVLTTVQPPTGCACALACRLRGGSGRLVVAGDRKGPASYDLPNTTFLSLQAQLDGPFELARQLPTGHYCRKNIAYLEAVRQGATCIYETDDDNAPLPSWRPREEFVTGPRVVRRPCDEGAMCSGDGGTDRGSRRDGARLPHSEGAPKEGTTGARTHGRTDAPTRWVNVYRYFTDALIWPRGLPLDEIHAALPAVAEGDERAEGGKLKPEGQAEGRAEGGKPKPEGQAEGRAEGGKPKPEGFTPGSSLQVSGLIPHPSAHGAARRAPIQQGLVNGSPDVDAVWRLVLDRPFQFEDRPSVCLAPGNWCPFNTQSTWWWPVAYPLLYIPSHCSFRMCDIWKSFVAQRCLWELGLGVVFHAPEVVQERNPHHLMRDFADEVPGYQRNHELVQVLERVRLEPGEGAVGANLLRCYEALIEGTLFPPEELALVKTWLGDLRALA